MNWRNHCTMCPKICKSNPLCMWWSESSYIHLLLVLDTWSPAWLIPVSVTPSVGFLFVSRRLSVRFISMDHSYNTVQLGQDSYHPEWLIRWHEVESRKALSMNEHCIYIRCHSKILTVHLNEHVTDKQKLCCTSNWGQFMLMPGPWFKRNHLRSSCTSVPWMVSSSVWYTVLYLTGQRVMWIWHLTICMGRFKCTSHICKCKVSIEERSKSSHLWSLERSRCCLTLSSRSLKKASLLSSNCCHCSNTCSMFSMYWGVTLSSSSRDFS